MNFSKDIRRQQRVDAIKTHIVLQSVARCDHSPAVQRETSPHPRASSPRGTSCSLCSPPSLALVVVFWLRVAPFCCRAIATLGSSSLRSPQSPLPPPLRSGGIAAATLKKVPCSEKTQQCRSTSCSRPCLLAYRPSRRDRPGTQLVPRRTLLHSQSQYFPTQPDPAEHPDDLGHSTRRRTR